MPICGITRHSEVVFIHGRDDIVLIATRGGRRPAWIMLLKYKEAISATLAKRERELEAALKVLEFPETIRYTCVYLV